MTERDLLVLQLAEIRGHLTPDIAGRIRSAGGDLSRHLSGTHLDTLHKLADEILARGSKLVAGRYELLEKLGEGGMAVVFKARDLKLNRLVALKGLGRTDPEDLERFIREARTAAQLRHPSIVEVYDIVTEGEQTFITMKYIEGKPLAEEVGKRPLRLNLEALAQAADGLHHAHREGIVHRDVKPDNILVDVEGRAYLSDFGLARKQKGATRLTLSGMVLGTPAYMSPEQARGTNLQVDAQSDVYGLGASLYELLTGVAPFSGQSAYEVLAAVVEQDPEPPRKRRPAAPRELEVICLKAMAKEKKDRYATAAEFAEEVRRYLRNEPISARPPSAVARGIRWARRHPAHVLVASILVLSIGGVAVGFTLMKKRVVDREEAERLFQKGMALVQAHEADVHRGVNREAAAARTREGIGYLERAAAADPSYALPRVWLGRAWALLGDRDRAFAEYGAAIAADPECAEAYYGRAILRSADLQATVMSVRTSFRREALYVHVPPDTPAMQAARRDARSDLEKSLELWRGAVGEEMPERDRLTGLIHLWSGEYEQAAAAFEAYLRKREYDSEALMERAITLIYLKRLEEAARCYEAALRIQGNSRTALLNWIVCEHNRAIEAGFVGLDPRGILSNTAERVGEALRLWPQSADLWTRKALVIDTAADWELDLEMDAEVRVREAEEAVANARKLAPDDPLVLEAIAKVRVLRIKWKRLRGRDPTKEYEEARTALDRALAAHPGEEAFLLERSQLHVVMMEVPGTTREQRLEWGRRAIEDLDALHAQRPDGPAFLLSRGGTRAQMIELAGGQDFAEAVKDLDRALEIHRDTFTVRMQRAITFTSIAQIQRPARAENWTRVIEECDAAIPLRSSDPRPWHTKGEARLERALLINEPDAAVFEAIEDLDRAIERGPSAIPAWFYKVKALKALGERLENQRRDGRTKLREAVAVAEEGVRRMPLAGPLVLVRGAARGALWRAELRTGKIGEDLWKLAIEDLTTGWARGGHGREGLVSRGNLRFEMARIKKSPALRGEAHEDFDEVLRADPRDSAALNGRGLVFYEEAKEKNDEELYVRSIADLEMAVKYSPGVSAALASLSNVRLVYGELLVQKGKDPSAQYDAALAEVDRIIAGGEKYLMAYLGRAQVLRARANWRRSRGKDWESDLRDAVAACDEVLKVNSRFAEVYLVRGQLYLDLGRKAEAKADFLKAIDIDPRYRSMIQPFIDKADQP